MQLFKELQKSFRDALFNHEKNLASEIKSDHADERINVYRLTVVEVLRNALALTFPGFWALVGKECADAVAYAFCTDQDNLPLSGCLDEWGEKFPFFVGELKELNHLPYLEDYMRFEWAGHLSYRAAAANPLSPEKLSELTEEGIDKMHFSFMPSCQLYNSNFPIAQIHEVAINPDADPFDLKQQSSFALLLRVENDVRHFWVNKALWHFCAQLRDGYTLMNAAETIQKEDPNFDLTQAIHFLLHNQFLNDKLSFERKNNGHEIS